MMLILLLLSSLQVTKPFRAAKEKMKVEFGFSRLGKLGKHLAMFSLISLLGWAMLVFVAILMLLNCSCTMFALVLDSVLLGQTSNLGCIVWIRSPFLILIHCP